MYKKITSIVGIIVCGLLVSLTFTLNTYTTNAQSADQSSLGQGDLSQADAIEKKSVWEVIEHSFHSQQRLPNGQPLTEDTLSPFNPWLDYRLSVTYVGPSGQSYVVPGFFAGDGNDQASGDVWKTRFRADEAGVWSASLRFEYGGNINIESLDLWGAPLAPLDGKHFSFRVRAKKANAPGFEKLGRLQWVNKPYLKFRDGPYFIKAGTNSPENFLSFDGFDSQDPDMQDESKSYTAHEEHWALYPNSPNWTDINGKEGKNIIGAINYLASKHQNVFYFLPSNIGGDGNDVWPFTYRNSRLSYDISKLDQWEKVFAWAQKRGLMLHFQFHEQEFGQVSHLSDPGQPHNHVGVRRKLYLKTMLAMFGHHLAVTWSLCEENTCHSNSQFTADQLAEMAEFIDGIDPYGHTITVHTDNNTLCMYDEMLEHASWGADWNECWLRGTSNQVSIAEDITANISATRALFDGASPARTVVINVDEPWSGDGLKTGASAATTYRKQNIYDVLFNGSNLEMYMGGGRDISEEDFTGYADAWDSLWYARKVLQHFRFWEMTPDHALVTDDFDHATYGDARVMAQHGKAYLLYFPQATNAPGTLDLSHTSPGVRLNGRWYNPRSGQYEGPVFELEAATTNTLPAPPSDAQEDWVLAIR